MPLFDLATGHIIQCMGLNQNLIPVTDAVYYIPEFITEDEETYLIRKVGCLRPLNFKGAIFERKLCNSKDL
jgi:hypothetical protein